MTEYEKLVYKIKVSSNRQQVSDDSKIRMVKYRYNNKKK